MAGNLLEAPFPVVMAVFAEGTYGSATDLGLMYGVFGAGALAGALVYSSIGHVGFAPRGRDRGIAAAASPTAARATSARGSDGCVAITR